MDMVLDGDDNCVEVANTPQTNSDGDSLGDACDNCPASLNEDQANADGDVRGDLCDNCVNVANDDQADANGDGTGDLCADDDGDGLTGQEEADLGTDPTNPDTDGDGLMDGDEGPIGLDPLDPDWDDDLVFDGADVCPFTPDPLQEDADGDGVGDACEPGARDVLLYIRKAAGSRLNAQWTDAAGAAGHDLYTHTLDQLWLDSSLGHDTIIDCDLTTGPSSQDFAGDVGNGTSQYYLLSVLLPDTDEYGINSAGDARRATAAVPACR